MVDKGVTTKLISTKNRMTSCRLRHCRSRGPCNRGQAPSLNTYIKYNTYYLHINHSTYLAKFPQYIQLHVVSSRFWCLLRWLVLSDQNMFCMSIFIHHHMWCLVRKHATRCQHFTVPKNTTSFPILFFRGGCGVVAKIGTQRTTCH